LYPAQMELIQQRFAFVRRTLEAEMLQSKVKYLLEKSRDEFQAAQPGLDRKFADTLRELDEHLETVIRADEPTVLPEGNFDRLIQIGNVRYKDAAGENKPLLTHEEVRLLSIRQ